MNQVNEIFCRSGPYNPEPRSKSPYNRHQIEGLLVDRDVKFSDLKGLLNVFLKRLFGEEIKMRFRPHFFPFTEPSFEVDMTCMVCDKKGCSSCGHGGWMEMMGAGMVNPSVFKAAGYNPKNWQGFAFGMGLDRLAMMKYNIDDVRLLRSGDLKFLEQF